MILILLLQLRMVPNKFITSTTIMIIKDLSQLYQFSY